MSGISLLLNGNQYFGWTSAEVTASMTDATRTFSVTMAEVNLGSLGESFWAAPGDEVEILADSITVLKGFINEYLPSFNESSHTVTITGRGKSQDSVDCSAAAHATGRFENMTVQGIANELAGIVSNTVDAEIVTPLVQKFQVNQGETIVGAISRLADSHGLSIMGNADGSMSLVRGTSSNRYKGVYLREGAWPLKSASATISDHQKFSSYDMKTQMSGAQNRFGTDAASEIATVTDATVRRFRPYVGLMSVAGDSQSAATAADWRARRIAGKGVNVDATVQGFTYAGEIWEPNKLIYLNSQMLKCDHELLIESVTYREDESGTRTDLKLVPPKSSKSEGGRKASGSETDGDAAFDGPAAERVAKPKIPDPGEFNDWAGFTGVQ